MRRRPRHEEINDALGLGGKHRWLGSQGIGCGPGRTRRGGSPRQKGHDARERQRRGADADSRLLEEIAPGDGLYQILHVRRIVISSSITPLLSPRPDSARRLKPWSMPQSREDSNWRPPVSLGDQACGFRVILEMRNSCAVILENSINFRCGGAPRQASAESVSGATGGIRTPILSHPARQGLRRFEKRRVIERRQSLERRIGAHAPHRAKLARRRVERGPTGVRRGAANEGVEGAAVVDPRPCSASHFSSL